MFKLKKYCALCVCLVFVINLFVSLEVQAVSKSEAIEFYNYFSSAINESNISNIKYYFLFFSEDEIIENFRFANVTYPKTSAYFYIAKGYQKIGELENAYKYYSQAINSINTLKNASIEFKSLLYKHRAICNFRIIENSNLNDEEKIKKMFDDFEISLRYNANDYNTFHWLGTVCYYLGYYKEALDYLYRANDLCEDYETAKEIQEQIEKTKDKEFWRNMKDLSITAAPFLLKGAFYAIKLFCGGGGGQDQY